MCRILSIAHWTISEVEEEGQPSMVRECCGARFVLFFPIFSFCCNDRIKRNVMGLLELFLPYIGLLPGCCSVFHLLA